MQMQMQPTCIFPHFHFFSFSLFTLTAGFGIVGFSLSFFTAATDFSVSLLLSEPRFSGFESGFREAFSSES